MQRQRWIKNSMSVSSNLISVKKNISEYEIRYGRKPGSVKLIAVSKNQSTDKIHEAFLSGQLAFGESYWQEANEKMRFLKEDNIEWHFIGSIQRNKTKSIAENFNWVQTVSSLIIASRLSEQRPVSLGKLNICLQVNISQEKNKSGISPNELFVLAEKCVALPNISLRGLMCIPQPTHNFLEQRQQFHLMKELYDSLCKKGMDLDTLSMGMSDDMEAAIAEGSTLVRLGAAIFGQNLA